MYLLSGAISLHLLAIMTKPSLSCLLCFLCMLAIPFLKKKKKKKGMANMHKKPLFKIRIYLLYSKIVNVDLLVNFSAAFQYRDRAGWPASLPYIWKIHVSMGICTRSGIRLYKRVPVVKTQKRPKSYYRKVIKITKGHFHNSLSHCCSVSVSIHVSKNGHKHCDIHDPNNIGMLI